MVSTLRAAIPRQADILQVFHTLWSEVGSELILLLLFCAGFVLFRLSTVRDLIPGGHGDRRNKSRLKELKTADLSPPRQEDRLPPSPALSGISAAGLVRRAVRKEISREPPSPAPTPTAAAARELRVRAALEAGQLEETIGALSEMCASGMAVPGYLVASAFGLVYQMSGDDDKKSSVSLLSRLPSGMFSADVIASVVEAASNVGDVVLLREVVHRASLANVVLPLTACEAVLRTLALVGDGNGVEVFDELLRGGFQPSESLLTAVVSACADSKHVPLAERAVAQARKAHGRVVLPLYTALMKVYGQARVWHKTCELYESMKQEGVSPDTVAYGSLIKAAVESGRPELARELFRESGNPDLLNYMSMIRSAGRERDLTKALRLLEELERSPLSVDATTYNCTLEACVACNDRAAADRLFQRMSNSGQIDVVSYNTYLKVLLAAGAQKEANVVLKEMHSRGYPPNAVTYNSLIRDAVTRQDIQRSWNIVEAMERNGVRPDAFTCSILMKGVKQSPCTDDIDKIINLIQRAKVTPDEVLVNCLLDACVRLRDPQRLTQVLEQFKATGVVPSMHAYATLIRAYGHARRSDRVWELWRELTSSRDAAAKQNEEVFAAMVEACLAAGDLRGGLSVFRGAREQLPVFPRSPSVFAACVKACVQSKQAQLAIELYFDTRDLLVCGKVTFNSLIDVLARQGDMARANELFRDMTLKNVTPDLISYSTLIKGHCSRGDLEQGLQLLGLMQRRGIAPDAVLFNSILDGCAHKQMRTLTEQVLRDMEAANIAPSNFTLSILAKLYGRCGDLEAAFRVVETYPKKYAFQVNAQVFTCLMSACIANGELPRALEVYERMASCGCTADAKTYQTLLSGCLRGGDLPRAGQLLKDALSSGYAARLEGDVVDATLLLAVRCGQVADMAAPLLDELLSAGVRISDRTINAVRRGGTSAAGAGLADDEQPRARRLSSFASMGERTPASMYCGGGSSGEEPGSQQQRFRPRHGGSFSNGGRSPASDSARSAGQGYWR